MAKTDPSAVAVARITARHTVIVAVITAIAGIVTGALANKHIGDSREALPQRWLQIDRIISSQRDVMRLVITVNGHNYSYPSTAVWVKATEHAPRERFLLPRAETHRVAIRALVPPRPGDEDTGAYGYYEFESPQVNEHASISGVRDQTYGIYSRHLRGESAPDIVITYSIE